MTAAPGLGDLYLSLGIGLVRALGVDATHPLKDIAFQADVPASYTPAELERIARAAREHLSALLRPTDWQVQLLRVRLDIVAHVVFGEGTIVRKPPPRRSDDNNVTA